MNPSREGVSTGGRAGGGLLAGRDPNAEASLASGRVTAAGSGPLCASAPAIAPCGRSVTVMDPGRRDLLRLASPANYRTTETDSDFRFGVSGPLRLPAEVYAAVRADESGAAVCAFGPFTTRERAEAFVARDLDGEGIAVPFELVFGFGRDDHRGRARVADAEGRGEGERGGGSSRNAQRPGSEA